MIIHNNFELISFFQIQILNEIWPQSHNNNQNNNNNNNNHKEC